MKYETRVLSMLVAPEGEPIFSEMATVVEIADEAAGEFVTLWQPGSGAADGKIAIDPTGWPTLKSAIDCMVKECRPDKESEPPNASAN